jgi:eukaryotic-like serine/threonine-protein kinase
MLDPQVSRFWQAALLSGLMDAQALMACWDTIVPAKRDDPENLDRRLARQAVQSRALTLWQAQQLLAGRTSGYKVDRYILLELIGQGGMGRVYLARDSRLNRQVALKILSPERMSNPRAIARFQREARVGAQLQHENLVRIYDFGESNGRFFLVMEYIEGKTIGTLISEHGRLPPATAVRLVRQVAMGLEHAYLKGLIHRDVNPYNILVTRDGTAKLADLGLAIDLAEEDHVTREGATVGTFDYVAPEQARHSHAADIRSDIYSLGCSMYHMCLGQVPFPSPSLPEKLFAHQALEPKPLDQLIPGFPEGLAAIVRRMIRKAPDERYATPMQVVQALEPYTEEPSSAGNRVVASLPIPLAEPKPTSSSAQPVQMKKAVAAEHHAAEPIPALIKTVAVLDGTEIAPLPATETGSGANPDETTRLPGGHGHEYQPSDPDFPLFLDLGPEPSLSEGLSRPKPRSAVDQLVSPVITATSSRRLATLWLWGSAALTTTVLIFLGLLAVLKPFSTTSEQGDTNSHPLTTTKVKSGTNADHPRNVVGAEPPIIVRAEGEDERQFPAQKLVEALQTAMGSRGWVELRNREPLHLTADQTLDFSSGRGRLIVRAAPGFQPAIEVELKGPQPLLTTGSGVPLELSGLTIKVHYPQQGASSTPPAVIVAAGSAKIDRCAFKVTGDFHPNGSRALVSNGGVLDINRSWFQGFDETINVTAMNRTPTRIQQTMIIPAFAPVPAQAQGPGWYGWGVQLQVGGGTGATKTKNEPPHLIMQHCTVEAAGLIDLTNAHPLSVLNVELNHCAIRAEALLACRPSSPASTQLHWQGVGNQYDILGRDWIVLSAREGTPAMSSAVTDLQSWLQFASGDHNTVQDKLKFLIDPKARTALDQPGDFRIQAPVSSQALPGADPALVGPWSKP